MKRSFPCKYYKSLIHLLNLHGVRTSIYVSFYVSVKEKRWVIFRGEEDPTSIPGDCFYADSSFFFSIKFLSYFRYLLYFALDLSFLYSHDCVFD